MIKLTFGKFVPFAHYGWKSHHKYLGDVRFSTHGCKIDIFMLGPTMQKYMGTYQCPICMKYDNLLHR